MTVAMMEEPATSASSNGSSKRKTTAVMAEVTAAKIVNAMATVTMEVTAAAVESIIHSKVTAGVK